MAWTDCYGGETLTVPQFQCLVCDGLELVPYLSSCRDLYLGHPKIVDYVACGRCGLVQQHPVPENLGSLYSAYPVHQPKSGLHEWFRRTLLKDVYFNWTVLPPGARLLDFGCGDGWYLEAVRKAGINCEGYEFQADHARQLESLLGVPVFSDVDRLIAERSAAFQAITLHNVLEHVADLGFIFAEAARCLNSGGEFFLCELHPFRQYEGTMANFSRGGETTEVKAFVHHISEFLQSAEASGFALTRFNERWHAEDAGRPPRLAAFLFGLSLE